MNITFIGLSCFLVESENGDAVLFDPFHDQPDFYLGLKFPRDIQADIVLVSHPDEDHSYLRHHLLKQRRPSVEEDYSPDVDVLPNLNLRGHLVREWNGDINIAFACTIDGIRILHLADNSHVLSKRQQDEIGHVDILFVSPPKYPNKRHIENIRTLRPKVVIPSHFIPVKDKRYDISREKREEWYKKRVYQDWVTNPYIDPQTIEMMMNVYDGARELGDSFPGSQTIPTSVLTLSVNDLPHETRVYRFGDCLGT